MSRRASPYIKETPPSFANNSIHAPLHSERGWGVGLVVDGGEAVDGLLTTAKKLRDTQRHPEFASIEIVVAAGDGKTDNDEIIEDESSLMRVRKAIAEHP